MTVGAFWEALADATARALPRHLRSKAGTLSWELADAALRGKLPPVSRGMAALHEAGHVVVGEALGLQIIQVRLAPMSSRAEEGCRALFQWYGLTRFAGTDAWVDPARDQRGTYGYTPTGCAARAVFTVAGIVAEDCFGGTYTTPLTAREGFEDLLLAGGLSRAVLGCLPSGVSHAMLVSCQELLLAVDAARVLSSLLPGGVSRETATAVFAWLLDAAHRSLRENKAALRRVERILLYRNTAPRDAIRARLHDLRPFNISADFAVQLGLTLPATWPEEAGGTGPPAAF
jgi:hypothetical protein